MTVTIRTPPGDPLRLTPTGYEGPIDIDLQRLHASLNSLGAEQLSALHRKLHILQMAHEANRWRSSELGYFDQVKALLP